MLRRQPIIKIEDAGGGRGAEAPGEITNQRLGAESVAAAVEIEHAAVGAGLPHHRFDRVDPADVDNRRLGFGGRPRHHWLQKLQPPAHLFGCHGAWRARVLCRLQGLQRQAQNLGSQAHQKPRGRKASFRPAGPGTVSHPARVELWLAASCRTIKAAIRPPVEDRGCRHLAGRRSGPFVAMKRPGCGRGPFATGAMPRRHDCGTNAMVAQGAAVSLRYAVSHMRRTKRAGDDQTQAPSRYAEDQPPRRNDRLVWRGHRRESSIPRPDSSLDHERRSQPSHRVSWRCRGFPTTARSRSTTACITAPSNTAASTI